MRMARLALPAKRHVAQVQRDADVRRDDDEQQIDERQVKDVPELEQLLRPLQIRRAAQQQRPLGREPQHFAACRSGRTRCRARGRARAAAADSDLAERADRRSTAPRRPGRRPARTRSIRIEHAGDAKRPQPVPLQAPRPGVELRARQLVAADRSRNADVQVPADEAGQHDDHHRPVRGRDDAVELERRVERDEHRADDAAEQVDSRATSSSVPARSQRSDPLARHVEERHEHQHRRRRRRESGRRAPTAAAARWSGVGAHGRAASSSNPAPPSTKAPDDEHRRDERAPGDVRSWPAGASSPALGDGRTAARVSTARLFTGDAEAMLIDSPRSRSASWRRTPARSPAARPRRRAPTTRIRRRRRRRIRQVPHTPARQSDGIATAPLRPRRAGSDRSDRDGPSWPSSTPSDAMRPAGPGAGAGRRRRRRGDRRLENLVTHLSGRHAERRQRVPHAVDHRGRSADERDRVRKSGTVARSRLSSDAAGIDIPARPFRR